MKFLFLRGIKKLQKSPDIQFYKMSQNRPFCLHSHFSQTRENRLKSSRWQFCTLSQKDALKKQKLRNCLSHRQYFFTLRCA